jgi:UDP-N-acetylglucosamine 2-epimerase (non-hydrolysing)
VEAFTQSPLPIVYPIHPRTRKRLRQQKLWKRLSSSRNVQLLPPLGYFDFLVLMKRCEMLLTDSGGLQEEATAPPMRKPVLVIRLSTERPEAVEAGFARVVGVKKEGILTAIENAQLMKERLPEKSPYGEGKAAEKIVEILMKELL